MAKGCFDVKINDSVAIPETFAQTQGSGSSRGERSSRKHKDPITGNSFISIVTRLARKSFSRRHNTND